MVTIIITSYGPIMPLVYRNHLSVLMKWAKKHDIRVFHLDGVYQHSALNIMTDKALAMGTDYIMYLEHDNLYAEDTLERLLNDDKDIVTGYYTLRRWPYMPIPLSKVNDQLCRFEFIDDNKADNIFEAEVGCFGSCLVKASVFDKLKKPYFTFTPNADGSDVYLPDVVFYIKAREAGYKIYVDGKAQVGHLSDGIVLTPSNFRGMQEMTRLYFPELVSEEDQLNPEIVEKIQEKIKDSFNDIPDVGMS